MGQENAFLDAIKEEPADDSLRLIFADWLEDNGQPERAEFIRLQLKRAGLPPDDLRHQHLEQREQDILNTFAEGWLGPLRQAVPHWKFWRGLVYLSARNREQLEHLQGLLDSPECLWVEGLQGSLTLKAKDLEWLSGSRVLSLLTSLDLGWNRMGADGVAALAASPYLARLTELHLRNNAMGDAGAAALAASPSLARLTFLDLTDNEISEAGAAALAAWPHLARLTSFDLSHNGIGAGGASALAASPYLARLEVLDLTDTAIEDAGAAALAGSPHLAGLTELHLKNNDIGDAGATALAASPHLARLAFLDLEDNRIGEEVAEMLQQRFGAGVTV